MAKHDANKFTPIKELPASALKLRDALLSSKPTASQMVELPGGVKVEVRELTVGQRNRLGQEGYDFLPASEGGGEVKRMNERFIPLTLIYTCYDPDSGEPLFTPRDVDAINALAESVVQPLFSAALVVAAMHSGAEEEGKADSEANDVSSSTSPAS